MTAGKMLSFIEMLFVRPFHKLVLVNPTAILVEILSSLNGRIDKFSGGAIATRSE